MDIQVLEILDGDRAIVSTKGLYRVVHRHDNVIWGELMPLEEAKALCGSVRRCHRDGKPKCEPITYQEAAARPPAMTFDEQVKRRREAEAAAC